jgi:hypothetical protein
MADFTNVPILGASQSHGALCYTCSVVSVFFRSYCLSVALCLLVVATAAFGEAPDFATAVRPILERSCYACHGPERQKSGYRLDVRDVALRGGDSGARAILPHDAENSPLIRFVGGADPDVKMPPENSEAPPLSEAEVALLRAWIDAGPSWPDEFAGDLEEESPQWSLEPLVSPKLPGDAANPIDAFIHMKLAEKGLAPSPEADRGTLIQRAHYDLIGLPPTPEEVDVFVANPDADAYAKLVDRLLASPRYGERWARHWLDTIQYADSHGYEHDVGRDNAWPYRDYVVAAFNGDTAWDRFIREQLAADHFYPERSDLTPAMGFLGASPFDFSTYLTSVTTFDYLARDTLVTQVTASLLSTTASCARCHNHKFDPIPQADYYALQAVFSGVVKGDVAYDADPAIKRERDGWEALRRASIAKDGEVLLRPANTDLARAWIAKRGAGATWTPLDIETFQSSDGATHTRNKDGVIESGGTRPDKATYTVTGTTGLSEITALRLDVHTVERLPNKGPGRADNGNLHLSEIVVRAFEPGAPNPTAVKFGRATADFNQVDWGIEKAIDGNAGTAWGIHPAVGMAHHGVFELAEPLRVKPGTRFSIALRQVHGGGHLIGAYSLSLTGDPPSSAIALSQSVEESLVRADADLNESQRVERAAAVLRAVAEEGLASLPPFSLVYGAAASVDIPDGAPTPKPATIEVPKPVHRMKRGDLDSPLELVSPGALSALAALPARFDAEGDGARRAALADWISSPDNVLTWRSVVNRIWHYHFGRGLCDTPSDIGRMGGNPSHPELIDWLAVWFRDEAGGSLKALHRLILTSETYRQSSSHRDGAAAADGENRFLWRQNIHRLDADTYRDYTNAVSRRLDLTMGGPGVQHFTQGPGAQLTPTLDYAAYDWDAEDSGRRSIYRYVWRGIADPFMESLDFPDLGLLSPKRAFSASSLQALTLYNNDFVLNRSTALAERLAGEAADLNGQIVRATGLLWYREPSTEEKGTFRAYAEKHGLAALCRVLLNSNEFLFLE